MKKGNHRTKGTLRFALKNPNGNGQSAIQLDFSYGDTRIRKSTGYKVDASYWDKDKQRVKNVLKAVNKDEINRELNELEGFIDEGIAELRRTKIVINKKEIIGIIDSFKQEEEEIEKIDLFSMFDKFIMMKESVLPKNRGNRSQTVEAYKQAFGFLKRFQNETGFEVEFENIDLEFYYKFIDYLQSLKKKDSSYYSKNTIGKHLKTIKTFLNFATYQGVNENFKYKLPEFKIVKEQTTAVYLTKEEKLRLFEYDFSNYPKLEVARDIFFIGCEIGQRVSDYNNLIESEIVEINGNKFFKIKQKKTGNQVFCLITEGIKSVLNKRHNDNPPKPIAEQYLNDRIKEACQMVGIDEMVKYERTEGGKNTIKMIPKYKLVSSHTARRTFCTILHKEGVDIHSIMTQSGHKTEKEFKNYIRISKELEVDRIVNLERFKNAFVKVK